MAKLTDTKIRALRPRPRPYKTFDAEPGLHVLVKPNGSRLWRLRLRIDGREQRLSLGSWPETQRDEAVARAIAVRQALKGGGDPAAVAAELRGDQSRRRTEATIGDSFEHVADVWLARQRIAGSTYTRNARIIRYLVDAFGETPITGIDKPMLRVAIQDIETRGGETARRALAIASSIWRYANAHDITDRNPVAGLESREILQPIKAQKFSARIDSKSFGQLLRAIDAYEGFPTVKLGLQLLARVFTRPGELRLATWDEVDFDSATWIVPSSRTKMRRDHIVPLATQTVRLLREAQRHRRDDNYVLPSPRPGRPISENALGIALKSIGIIDHVAHGFRSSASTLLREQCGYASASDVVEAQLAHFPGGVRGAYDRALYLEQRRTMMQRWADYLDELSAISADH